MSMKERRRLAVMLGLKKREMSLAEAAEALGLSYRQAKRIWKRYQLQGDAGLVHRGRGRAGARRTDASRRQRILREYRRHYGDFGPTLAAEHLARKGLEVDHETLRRWLLEEGLRTVGRGRRKHRQWRERKDCLGQMVQMDGSDHDWFEGRRGRAVLMVMVDDATNRTQARFSEGETTRACYDVLEEWIRAYGVPLSLYVDRDSIYRCERMPTVAEQVAGKEPQTQFGRAMEMLGVELILATSPQAKGRVERRNGLLQDRLVKEMRLAGIRDLEKANQFLERDFLPRLNRQFTVRPASAADMHREGPENLDEVLSWEEERVVRKDWTVAWSGRWFQIDKRHENLSLVDRKVVVRCLRSGEVQLLQEDRKLTWRELPARPQPAAKVPGNVGRVTLVKPEEGHPWRRFGGAAGKGFWKGVREEGRAARQAP